MGVRIDASGHYIGAFGVDHCAALQVLADRSDRLALDQDIRFIGSVRGDNGATFEDCRHVRSPLIATHSAQCAKTSGLGRRHGAFSLDDQPVSFRLAVLGEVEDGFAVTRAEIEIAARGDDFVVQRHRLRNDFAGRRDEKVLGLFLRLCEWTTNAGDSGDEVRPGWRVN
jgi:hypothetical protein